MKEISNNKHTTTTFGEHNIQQVIPDQHGYCCN
jgi:hypothetical protein